MLYRLPGYAIRGPILNRGASAPVFSAVCEQTIRIKSSLCFYTLLLLLLLKETSMPGGARLGDKAKGTDSHGCKVCTHTVFGPAVQGSSNVTINGKPAVRKGDGGIHMLCYRSNTWRATGGSSTVIVNGKPAFRLNDKTQHCGGTGKSISASADMIIRDSQTSGFKKAAKNNAPFVCNCTK